MAKGSHSFKALGHDEKPTIQQLPFTLPEQRGEERQRQAWVECDRQHPHSAAERHS